MANSFSSKKIQKNRFFVCISLREDQGSMDRDMQKTKWPYTQYTYFNCDNGIVSLDDDFQYPSVALEFVKNLYMECANYKIQEKNCQSDCQKYLSRWPVLRDLITVIFCY